MFYLHDRYLPGLLLQHSILLTTLLITLMLTCLPVNNAYSNESINKSINESAGRIIMSRGNVEAINDQSGLRSLKRGDTVYGNDIVKTGDNSKVHIRFIDNALLALNANSELAINTYVFSKKNAQDNQVLMELVKGGFRTLSGKIGKNNKQAYKVTAPSASIGIRGTSYQLQIVSNRLVVAVWQGGIVLQTSQGQFELGMNADFDFAEISPAGGFRGLLTPPAELSPDDTLIPESSLPAQTNSPTPIIDIPSPFERDENAFSATDVIEDIIFQGKPLRANDEFKALVNRNDEVLIELELLYGIKASDISNLYDDSYPNQTDYPDLDPAGNAIP